MLNRKSKWIIITIIGIALISLSVLITYQQLQSKAAIKADDFIGTYLVKTAEPDEYLSIMPNDEMTKDTYYLYDIEETFMDIGKCIKTDKNFATLYDQKGKVSATVVYLSGDYYLIKNGHEAIKLKKTGDEPVMPF